MATEPSSDNTVLHQQTHQTADYDPYNLASTIAKITKLDGKALKLVVEAVTNILRTIGPIIKQFEKIKKHV